MSYALHSSDINSLIYQYMIERGLLHSAFLLKNEAENISQDLPSGSLISYLEKALAIEELERHMNEKVNNTQEALAQGLAKCSNEFRLNHSHYCAYDAAISKNSANGTVEEVKDFMLLCGHKDRITRLVIRKGVVMSGYNLYRSIDGTIRM